MTDTRPSRRRRWVLPVLVLGVGTVVALRRRSAGTGAVAPRPVVVPVPPVASSAANGGRPAAAPAASPAAAPPLVSDAAPGAAAGLDAAAAAPGDPAPAPRRPVEPAPSPRPLLATPRDAPPPHGPGSALPLPDGAAPGPEFTIKGNAGSRLFHPPSSPYYGRTKAEVWFRTPEDAIAAGFTAYTPRRRSSG